MSMTTTTIQTSKQTDSHYLEYERLFGVTLVMGPDNDNSANFEPEISVLSRSNEPLPTNDLQGSIG